MTHRVKLPRFCNAWSYSRQFFTRQRALGNFWRYAALILYGMRWLRREGPSPHYIFTEHFHTDLCTNALAGQTRFEVTCSGELSRSMSLGTRLVRAVVVALVHRFRARLNAAIETAQEYCLQNLRSQQVTSKSKECLFPDSLT